MKAVQKRIKEAPPGAKDEDAEAAASLAEAFCLIEEYSDYIPDDIYRFIADGIHDWTGRAQWMGDATLRRRIMPLLVAKVIAEQGEEAE